MEELKRIADDSETTKEDDALWPPPNRVGQQELGIVTGHEHISFTTPNIGSLIDVNQSKDPEGLQVFYYLVQDLKCLVSVLLDYISLLNNLNYMFLKLFLYLIKGLVRGVVIYNIGIFMYVTQTHFFVCKLKIRKYINRLHLCPSGLDSAHAH